MSCYLALIMPDLIKNYLLNKKNKLKTGIFLGYLHTGENTSRYSSSFN